MRLIDLTLLNLVDFYISRISTMWKLGPCRSAWVPLIYSIQSHVHDQKKFFGPKSFSQRPTNQKFAKAALEAFSQIANKSYISMGKAQRLINSHSRIHSRKYLFRSLDLTRNWQNDILAIKNRCPRNNFQRNKINMRNKV